MQLETLWLGIIHCFVFIIAMVTRSSRATSSNLVVISYIKATLKMHCTTEVYCFHIDSCMEQNRQLRIAALLACSPNQHLIILKLNRKREFPSNNLDFRMASILTLRYRLITLKTSILSGEGLAEQQCRVDHAR